MKGESVFTCVAFPTTVIATLLTVVFAPTFLFDCKDKSAVLAITVSCVVVGAGATSSATLDSSTLPFRVGGTASTTEYFNGYISNVRMVNGTAVYTAPFTPPTAPLTAVTNTTLLLNANNASTVSYTHLTLPTKRIV